MFTISRPCHTQATHTRTHIPFLAQIPVPSHISPPPKHSAGQRLRLLKFAKVELRHRHRPRLPSPPPITLMTLANTPKEWKWWKNGTKKIGNGPGVEPKGVSATYDDRERKKGKRDGRNLKPSDKIRRALWKGFYRGKGLRGWGVHAGFAFSRFITYACFGLLDFRFRFNCNAWKLHNVSEVLRSLGPHVNAIWTAKAHTPGPAYKHASSVVAKVCLQSSPSPPHCPRPLVHPRRCDTWGIIFSLSLSFSFSFYFILHFCFIHVFPYSNIDSAIKEFHGMYTWSKKCNIYM